MALEGGLAQVCGPMASLLCSFFMWELNALLSSRFTGAPVAPCLEGRVAPQGQWSSRRLLPPWTCLGADRVLCTCCGPERRRVRAWPERSGNCEAGRG